ncbi:MAG: aspartyl/asparaginyl beta-hydroxylase domain-containing protein [Sphingomonadales bacterium]|nr:aspartyl/asparaginyl beta-hydroxylase domain-containing protein [Sphingomonadales bacterium]
MDPSGVRSKTLPAQNGHPGAGGHGHPEVGPQRQVPVRDGEALLADLPQPWIGGCGANAMFSLLAPHTGIPPHVGVANFRLLCHVPLVVPGRCWFRVGEQVRHWERGAAWVFDDSIEHEAMNETDALRVIMIFDIWHPDLSPAEQAAIATMVSAASIPVGAL